MKKLLLEFILITATVINMVGCASAGGGVQGSAGSSGYQGDTSTVGTQHNTVVEFTQEETNSSYDEATATKIEFSGGKASVSGSGASAAEGSATINSAGTFIISGESTDGQLIVNSNSKDNVHIVLSGLDLSCKNSAPIFIQAAEKTIITLAQGSTNILSDTSEYILNAESEPTAVLFSKDDLVINGSGKLVITANYNDGITSKDDLKIIDGTLAIQSADDGIVGKDLLAIKSADITINSTGIGLKSSNDTDTAKGFIYIQSGSFAIDSVGDAINSCNLLQIDDGNFEISSQDDGIHSDNSVIINGGDIDVSKSYEGMESNSIIINEGNVRITSSDDGINAATANTTTAATANADKTAQAPPQQGMGEAPQNGTGEVPPEMPDSGAIGTPPAGTDTQTHAFPQGGGGAMSSGDSVLEINGGYIVVNAEGDGIDVNGSAKMTAGTLIVTGSQSSKDSALDYDVEFEVLGGTILAVGAGGMAQATSSSSTVPTVSINLDTAQKADTILHIEDKSGNSLVTFAPPKAYQSIIFSSATMEEGAEYSLYLGGTATATGKDGMLDSAEYTKGELAHSFTIDGSVTTVGSAQRMHGGKGGGLAQGEISPQNP